MKEEIPGYVDPVVQEAKAHVEAKCKRVKSEVLSEVFMEEYTKDEVKTEVKVASDLKKSMWMTLSNA